MSINRITGMKGGAINGTKAYLALKRLGFQEERIPKWITRPSTTNPTISSDPMRARLVELLKKRENTREAEIAYRCFTRLLWDKPGRPKYPKFDWDFLEYHIIDGETYINERIVELRTRAGKDALQEHPSF